MYLHVWEELAAESVVWRTKQWRKDEGLSRRRVIVFVHCNKQWRYVFIHLIQRWLSLTHEYIFLLIRAAVQRFPITPERRCKSLGENAVFRCSVRGEILLYWCTTGAAADCNVVTDFVNTTYSSRYEIASNVTNSRLRVPASTRYNGTRFKCCYNMNRRICSKPAKLIVVRSGKYACVYSYGPATYSRRYLMLYGPSTNKSGLVIVCKAIMTVETAGFRGCRHWCETINLVCLGLRRYLSIYLL